MPGTGAQERVPGTFGDSVERMVAAMEEAFGSCFNFGEREAVCPQEIPIDFIARLNGDWLRAKVRGI